MLCFFGLGAVPAPAPVPGVSESITSPTGLLVATAAAAAAASVAEEPEYLSREVASGRPSLSSASCSLCPESGLAWPCASSSGVYGVAISVGASVYLPRVGR